MDIFLIPLIYDNDAIVLDTNIFLELLFSLTCLTIYREILLLKHIPNYLTIINISHQFSWSHYLSHLDYE